MIGKVIRMNQARRRSPAARARSARIAALGSSVFALTRYIVDADPYGLIAEAEREILSLSDYALAVESAGVEPGEKVEAYGVRNLHGRDLADWQAEMLAVAARTPRIQSPLIHIILSLREGEGWTADERDETIRIVVETLGLERCQLIWAEHSNTANAHLHLSIVRVDPATGNRAGTEWLIDDLHQALALVVERQGRTREPNALYFARGGAVYDVDTHAMVRDAAGRYCDGWYKGLGKKHDRVPAALRPKRASIIAAAEQSNSWAELHALLRDLGVTYDRAGSGARISAEGHAATASQVGPSLSRARLEKRLGVFEPDLGRLDPGYEAYRHAFEGQLGGLRRAREEERQRLDRWTAATLGLLPPGRRKVVGRAVRAEASAAKEHLAEAFGHAIARCTKNRLTQQAWEAAGRPVAPAPIITPALLLPASMDGVGYGSGPASSFQRHHADWATEYRTEGHEPLFTDHRIVIIVHATNHAAGVDEALRLANARWGTVRATGSEAFLGLVASRAAELGITVVGADRKPLLPTPEPAPEIEPALPAEPVVADWRKIEIPEDPIRRERIEEAIWNLRQMKGLPLRRVARLGDTPETGRTGKLEIVLGGDRTSLRHYQLAREAVFDEDRRVQAFLEERRKAMLEECWPILAGALLEPSDRSTERMLKCLPGWSEAHSAAKFALEDHDFMAMIKDVRAIMAHRTPEAAASPPGEEARAEKAITQSLQIKRVTEERSPRDETQGISVVEQLAWLRSRGKGR
ncbi:relaxase/mobilization nuclease domain-containing protein [Sphingosinicella sp. LY1275]|uniref:relaxase/mobilization nuclease domain-containing protein n=1 Tax=Sphingosinicella sp. LY1275 TaxID=3095379 RepID=UPI002ADEC7A8|nr:relaxase/mobilization nuclease domain-containing protein [Sphingosinicella sp. LY1275]MEA1015325.1 relaxase/mobilization nuclease domain-containing protein [Sphingosinicella sp. LY1275]